MGGEASSNAETLALLLVCNPRFLRATTGHAAPEDGLRELADRGLSRVAATLAGEGVVGLEEGRWVRILEFSVETVDTNGEGDVFHWARAVGELHGWFKELTLTFANAVAAMKYCVLVGRRDITRELASPSIDQKDCLTPCQDRDIVVVCLGKEPAEDSWLEDWNRPRPVHKIEAIELRADKRYGKFFTHQPARAHVEIK